MLFASIWLFGLIFHLIVGSIGLEPMKTKANRFTVYPVCHFGNYPFCGSRRIQTCDTPFQRTCGNWTTPYRFCGKRWNRITLTGFSVRRIHHVCHLSIFSLYPHTPHRREKQCGNSNYCCGDSTRTNDLWAMIPTSYQLLHSAILSWKLLCTHNIHIYVVLASTTLHSQYNNTIDIAYIS